MGVNADKVEGKFFLEPDGKSSKGGVTCAPSGLGHHHNNHFHEGTGLDVAVCVGADHAN